MLLEAPAEKISGEAYNMRSGEQNYRIRDPAEVVRRRLPECEVAFSGACVAGSP